MAEDIETKKCVVCKHSPCYCPPSFEGEKKTDDPQTLIDIENKKSQQAVADKAVKLHHIALEIDTILKREDITCGEWGEIVEMFSMRIGGMVAITKINSLK